MKLLVFALTSAIFIANCHATYGSIQIQNPGFEVDDVPDDTTGTPTGWSFLSGSGGYWDINSTPYSYWTAPAPGGDQVVFLSPAINTAGSVLSQELTTTLQDNAVYELSGYVGHPNGYGNTHGTTYTAELWAGGNLLASTTPSSGPEGKFAPFSLNFNSAGSSFIGELLEIRLSSSQPQTAFDEIMLDGPSGAGVVPEPSSVAVWAGIAAVFGMGTWATRRAIV